MPSSKGYPSNLLNAPPETMGVVSTLQDSILALYNNPLIYLCWNKNKPKEEWDIWKPKK